MSTTTVPMPEQKSARTIRDLSGIPYFGGTWTGELRRIEDANQVTGTVRCTIKQTWRNIDFVFEGPLIPAGQEREIHSTRGKALTAAMFLKNADNIHVRYIYKVYPMTRLEPNNVNYQPGQGTAVLYLAHDESGKKILQGTYYSDKMRGGDVWLQRALPASWWSQAWTLLAG